MSKVALIIPCFNEERRLNASAFIQFIGTNPAFDLYFVNDGSTDNTAALLNNISDTHKDRIFTIHKERNQGKAAAIQDAALHIKEFPQYSYAGYTDADLSTSLEQCKMLADELKSKNADCAFGSRIKKYGADIQRSAFRHLCGRFLATIIDNRFRLGIYDTQCGAKFFPTPVLADICQEPFKTKWLFDVEIFLRLFRKQQRNLLEIPLQNWKDPGNSKLSLLDFPRIAKEVYLLFKYYPK